MNRLQTAVTVGAALAMCAATPAMLTAQQPQGQRPAQTSRQPSTPPPTAARPSLAPDTPRAQGESRRSRSLNGFSVVLVLGDLQGATGADDVPPAARKALNDMREFLPYTSYRLLDAGWLMCCGNDTRPGSAAERRAMSEPSNLALRGADEQEYEVKLYTSRAEGGRVLVRFVLFRLGSPAETTTSTTAAVRTLQRRLADLEDRARLQEKQIAETRKKVDVGMASGAEIPKMEVELRSMQREIEELRDRISSGGGRSNVQRVSPSAVIDTSFTMDIGETVVVGASRPRGATKALIALVTAVPRAGASAARE